MTRLYRIVFVTGMKPKPPVEQHRAALLRALAAGLERVRPAAAGMLAANPDAFGVVAWTPLLYAVARDIDLDLPGLERLIANPIASAAEKRELDAPQRRLARLWHLLGDSFPFLTRLMASPPLQETLADVHRYLANDAGLGDAIRGMVATALESAWARDERVLLIGHSLGSVIAYDSLWELSRARTTSGRVDCLVTLGSPLATRFVRRGLKGAERRGPERYPSNIRRWINFAAHGEMVALHRRLAPFFGAMVTHGLTERIDDHADVYNHYHGERGIDPHKSYGYLISAPVAGVIGDWLLE